METNNKTISAFRGKYAFLSNFYETEIYCWGFKYRNAEAAFQAMKNPLNAGMFEGLNAKEAKKLGRTVELRKDWEKHKEGFMYTVCLAKFTQNAELKEKLLATGDKVLEEGNNWGDTEWGICNGVGKNLLGNILMRIRGELQKCRREKFEAEMKNLHKLHALRDYIWGNFNKSEPIYHQLLHVAETAIADKLDDIALLRGAKIIKTNKRKKYVFEVGRNCIGAADVYLNGELLVSLADEVVKATDANVIYTDIVKGMGSRIPDAVFVKALLYSPGDDICHLSDKVKAVLDRDVPKEILDELQRNLERSKKDGN